jgi:hypothetical protein
MSISENTPDAVWQLQSHQAQLNINGLAANVELGFPMLGLNNLEHQGVQVAGCLLGVSKLKTNKSTGYQFSDVFARGEDLVVNYPQTDTCPYSMEVYWRARSNKQAVIIDLLLSLETPLLESFPGVTTRSQITANEAWLVSNDGAPATEISDFQTHSVEQEPIGVVLRPQDTGWSYVEMPHPDDPGELKISASTEGQIAIERQLAGTFLEKGVIRRLCMRGAFVPREGDLLVAQQLFKELAAETPPLTA